MEKSCITVYLLRMDFFFLTDFLLGDFSFLCSVSHSEKKNMQLKSSMTVTITKSFSVSLAWKKLFYGFHIRRTLEVHASVSQFERIKNFSQNQRIIKVGRDLHRSRSISCSKQVHIGQLLRLSPA